MTTRQLIVNADDFGLSEGVNRAIVQAFEHGIVRSTSLMVRQKAAPQAAELAKLHPSLDIGLHFDLGEWESEDGVTWNPRYSFADPSDAAAVQIELDAQLNRFRELLGRDPTHLDSHQHVHRRSPAREILINAGQILGVPVRRCTPAIAYLGKFYVIEGRLERVSVDALIRLIEALPPGVTEMCCHPGDDDSLETAYRTERRHELTTLTDPRVREALSAAAVTLTTFAALAAR